MPDIEPLSVSVASRPNVKIPTTQIMVVSRRRISSAMMNTIKDRYTMWIADNSVPVMEPRPFPPQLSYMLCGGPSKGSTREKGLIFLKRSYPDDYIPLLMDTPTVP